MDVKGFTPGAPGQLVRITDGGGSYAFLPARLPVSQSVLTSEVVLALSEADAELGRLDGQAANLPDPEILIAPFLRREAILSSRIEGTQTTYSDLVLFEAAEEQESPTPDTRDVTNYVEALKYGVRRVAEIPISRKLILEIHEILMRGTDAPKTRPGAFRDRQVYIAPSGLSIADARYVPPPVHAIDDLVNNLVEYLQKPDRLPLLVRLAIAHYQFESIHPFIDGNGRIGRLLMVLMLCEAKRISAPMLYLSAYFERRRMQYNDLMLSVSKEGAWEPWIVFFLQGVAVQARDAIQRTRQLHALRAEYRRRLSGARKSTALLTLVDELFRLPVLSNRTASRILHFSWQAANENIQKLVDAGIVRKVDMPGRKQYFVAHEIISIIDRAEAVPPLVTDDSVQFPPPTADGGVVTQPA